MEEKVVPFLPLLDRLSDRSPFCLLTRSVRTLLAENKTITGTLDCEGFTLIYTLWSSLCSSEERSCTNFIHVTFI